MTAVALAVDDLILLFTGDEWTAPAPADVLAERICEWVQPKNATELKNRLYGSEWPNEEIALEELDSMAHGFANWISHGGKLAA